MLKLDMIQHSSTNTKPHYGKKIKDMIKNISFTGSGGRKSSVLSPQSSVLSPQSSVLSPQSSVLSPHCPLELWLGAMFALLVIMVGCPPETTPTEPARSVAATGITIDGNDAFSLLTNRTRTLTATVTPTNHTDGEVQWNSSNESIVTVVKSNATQATCRGIAEGTTTITASIVAFQAEVTVSVTTEETPATGIVIDQGDSLSVASRHIGTLTATVTPASHTDGDVEWSSTKDDIVAISKDTFTEATFEAKAAGTATVTASIGVNIMFALCLK